MTAIEMLGEWLFAMAVLCWVAYRFPTLVSELKALKRLRADRKKRRAAASRPLSVNVLGRRS
jgi:hypothetical protein